MTIPWLFVLKVTEKLFFNRVGIVDDINFLVHIACTKYINTVYFYGVIVLLISCILCTENNFTPTVHTYSLNSFTCSSYVYTSTGGKGS